MAKKIIAYCRTKTGFDAINVYQAIRMKNEWIRNQDEELIFYDAPDKTNAEPMFPKRTSKNGRGAHFCYYPGSKHIGIATETSMTHQIYQLAVSQMKELKLYTFGEEITLYIDMAMPEYFIKTEYNSYFIDVFLKLKGTEPKSFFYKWGGKIAIEVLVSHKVDRSKANDLRKLGIQVFELKVYHNQRISEDIENTRQFSEYTNLIMKRIIKNKNVGKFVNDVIPVKGSLWEWRYLQLIKFEQEVQELKKRIEQNEKQLKEQEDNIEKYSRQFCCLMNKKQELEREIEEREKTLYIIESGIDSNKELIRKNQILEENNRSLESALSVEKEKVTILENELKIEKGKGIWQKLFDHKK